MNEITDHHDDGKPRNQAYYDEILGAWVPAGSDTSNLLKFDASASPNVSPLYGQSRQEITKAHNNEAAAKNVNTARPSLS